jgi:hypothetical protein
VENEQIVRVLLEFLVKNAPGFFSMLGFLSAIILVIILRRPVVKIWRKWAGEEAEGSGGRRRDDTIIIQFLDAYKRSVEMGSRIVDEVHGLAEAIREQTAAQNEGFRDVHRKLDKALNAGGHGSHAKVGGG